MGTQRDSATHIREENTPQVYALSLNTRNWYSIHKNPALFISTKHIQRQDLYFKMVKEKSTKGNPHKLLTINQAIHFLNFACCLKYSWSCGVL